MSTVFKNYLIEKPLVGRISSDKILLGEKVIEKENDYYSSNTIDSPIASKKDLFKNKKGRFYYGRDYDVYRKYPTLVNHSKYNILYIDIENTGGIKGDIKDRVLTVITLHVKDEKEYITMTTQDMPEIDILAKVVEIFLSEKFIITGWNVRYDISFILDRYKYLTGIRPNILCPVIDLMALYKHYVSPTEKSFKLDYILKKNGLGGKLEYKGDLEELRVNDWDKYVEYNKRDVEALEELDTTLGLFRIAETIVKISGCLWQDVIFNSRIIEAYIYNWLNKKDMVFRDRPEMNEEKEKYTGALVHQPIPGYYKNVRCFDFNSLYPNIIISFNMSPETINMDGYVAANGVSFSNKKKGFVPEILEYLLEMRKKLKAEGDYYGQLAYKILANSFYGVSGSSFFRFYNRKMAEAITLTGQECNKYVCEKLRELFEKENIVLAGDTDSVYIDMDGIEYGDELESYINRTIMKAYGYEHRLDTNTLAVKDEYGAVKAIFLSIKKNYILQKPNADLVIKGFDKSDRPDIGMDIVRDMAKVIFRTGHFKVINAAKKFLRETIEENIYDTKWYRRYKISKDISEYKTKQAWMDGLKLFDFYYPEFGKSKDRGYYVPLLGDRRVSAKTGRILKGYQEYVLCVPNTVDFKKTITEVLRLTGYRIDIQKIYDSIYNPMIKPFEVLTNDKAI